MKVHTLLNSITLRNSIDIGIGPCLPEFNAKNPNFNQISLLQSVNGCYILSEWLVYHSMEGHKIEHLYYEQMLEMH